MTKAETNIVLFSITLCWASSYIFIKNIPVWVSPFAYITLTAGIASIILASVFFKKLKRFDISTLRRSFIIACIICCNLYLERMGISKLPASTASFVAALTIVFVPLLMLVFKKKLSPNNIAGACLIITGLVFTSGMKPGEALNFGLLEMVGACVFMAIYIITVDSFAKKSDPLLLGIGQMFFTAIIGYSMWFIEQPRTFLELTYTNELMANIFLLAFFAKAYAYIMLMYSQKYASPITVTVMAATEPVITMGLAMLVPHTFGTPEIFTLPHVIGGVFIVTGAIFAGTDFLRSNGREKSQLVGGMT